MEIALVILLAILFPTAAITIVAAVIIGLLLAVCWPLLPIMAIFGATLSAMSKGIKS